MNTITASMSGPRRNYWPLKYGEIPMISRRQKDKLTSLIYQNIIDENSRELKLMELEDLTESDADSALYEFSTGKWS